jgi:hypothetical protein
MSLVNILFWGTDYGNMLLGLRKDKRRNFQAIKDLYGQIGFKLMLNELTH